MRLLLAWRLIILMCLLLAPWFAGCGGDGGSSSSGDDGPVPGLEMARSPLARNLSPDAGPSELEDLADGSADFAADLFRELKGHSQNLLFSPHSIQLTLAMAYAGAKGQTRTEMEDALRFRLFGDNLHAAFNRLDLILENRQSDPLDIGDTPPVLYIANALWAGQGHSFLASFLDVLALNYDAGVRLTDFQTAPEAARQSINDWVEDATNGLIPELFGVGTISPLARLVLANAIYFQAHWQWPFDLDSTQDAPFYPADSEQVMVKLMTHKDVFGYAQGTDYQAVELPCSGGAFSMVVILPAPGQMDSFEQGLTGNRLMAICNALEAQLVRVYLPRFALDPGALRLDNALARMGMATAFSEDADFSGMNGTGDLLISQASHKTFVSVDEFGVEAAAASGVVAGPTSGNPLYTFRADRPFLFLIQDIETRTLLFMGRVADPGT